MLILGAGNAHILILRARHLQLCLRLLHIQLRIQAGVEQLIGQQQRLLIRRNGRIQDGLLRIQATHLEIVKRQLRLQHQLHVHHVGGAGLRILARRTHGASYPAPDIRLPTHFQGQRKIVVLILDSRKIGRAVFRFTQASRTHPRAQKRKIIGPLILHHGACLGVLRFGDF